MNFIIFKEEFTMMSVYMKIKPKKRS